jgi:hypothetical protein
MVEDDSVRLLRYDLSNQAKTLSEIVINQRAANEAIHELHTDRAVRAVDRQNLDERIKRIEKRMDELVGIGRWILLAFAASFVAAVGTFIVNGGLKLVGGE